MTKPNLRSGSKPNQLMGLSETIQTNNRVMIDIITQLMTKKEKDILQTICCTQMEVLLTKTGWFWMSSNKDQTFLMRNNGFFVPNNYTDITAVLE